MSELQTQIKVKRKINKNDFNLVKRKANWQKVEASGWRS